MARPSNKIAPAAKPAAAKPAAAKPAAAKPMAKPPAAKPQSDSVQQAKATAAAKAAPKPQSDSVQQAKTDSTKDSKKMQEIRETQRETRRAPNEPKSTRGGPGAKIQQEGSLSTAKTAKKYKEAGPNFKGAGSNFYTPPPYVAPKDRGKKVKKPPKEGPGPGPDVVVPIPTITTPIGAGFVKAPNLSEKYTALISKLTLNLLKNAENLLFAYDFQTIERIASYVLDTDDAAQRGTNIVSNIKRSFSDVPTTELQIRDRLNAVINQIAQEIGDLTPASSKLAKFGIKKDTAAFQGGTPRIQNGTTLYDLELTLPSLEGFNYSVSYRIKCYEID
jgi:hypothetical protein